MADTKKTRTIRLTESQIVDMVEKLVAEAIKEEKQNKLEEAKKQEEDAKKLDETVNRVIKKVIGKK